VHPELPFEVFRKPTQADPYKVLVEKSRMMTLSPFDETLFLDADTLVLDHLDFGFTMAARFGLACCICECPWARRFHGLTNTDLVEYNTGVLFFTRAVKRLFERWEQLAPQLDSALDAVVEGQQGVMSFNDQASFAKAVGEWDRTPFILPVNWNFRPRYQWTWFGPLKIWHDYADPPRELYELNMAYRRRDTVIQFHNITKK
jgi:hypothetical protein